MRRREFIAALGSAAALPLAARAQQTVRRVGVLMNLAENDPETQARRAVFLKGMQELGWSEGHNLRIDYRWGVGDSDRHRRNAVELIALSPDVILANGGPIVGPLQRVTRSVPIVFVSVVDPVGAGYVASLAQPGGNMTGFTLFEYSLSGKWLELLKQIAPALTRAAVLRDPTVPSGIGQLGAIQGVASSLGVEVVPVDVREASEIERAVTAFARQPNSGMIVTTSTLAGIHRDLIAALAARHRLPAVYPYRYHVTSGGLISYGPDVLDQYRRAPAYIDRILKGEKPADLPVQAPTRYELAINLKTAKALGINMPASLVFRADEVIE